MLQGDCGAAFQLGAMLAKGDGDPGPWWRAAAAAGHTGALVRAHHLTLLYLSLWVRTT